MNLKNVIIRQIIILIFQVVLYFGCEFFQKNPKNMDLPIDKKIPALPYFALIYVLWFPLIAIFPISLFKEAKNLYELYVICWIIDIVISVIIYLAYPTTCTRPKDLENIKGGWMLKILYKFSYKGLNCSPSMHCSISTLVFIFALAASTMPINLRIIYSTTALGIILSTLFTKQHVLIDLVTGVLLALVIFLILSQFI
ncbi:phosphatase PAP2 family protein [Anaerococcus sp. Marseille-P9784]|uniref:phosphatase PAP2 family protein n=1 Tax=Anaerococcus sp. Marseille-P9784 TaxID=2614127 RepID=UPI00124AAA0E|nr:phosphatase PAP2 family protein [Anaerococcus sp. Marseille-P9784]